MDWNATNATKMSSSLSAPATLAASNADPAVSVGPSSTPEEEKLCYP